MQRLRLDTHGHLGWRPAQDYAFARRMARVPLAVTEIGRVAQGLPILFQKVDGRWQAVAVMGPVEGANVNVTGEGRWRTCFVPAMLRVYPFGLDATGQLSLWQGYTPETLVVADTQPFFEDGEFAPRLKQTSKFLQAVHAGVNAAHDSLIQLEEAGVLDRWEMPGIDEPKHERALTGLYALGATRIESLGDTLVLKLFRAGALRWIHAHLDSLHHSERFKALAKAVVAPEIAAPCQPDKIEQAADILAAIAEDLGDAEL